MSRQDMMAVQDTMRAESGLQPIGYLTGDERTVLSFVEQLVAFETLADLGASWTKM